MSRRITVIGIDGEEDSYGLSVASLEIAADGRVREVKVVPYVREEAGVEFIPRPLVIDLRTGIYG